MGGGRCVCIIPTPHKAFAAWQWFNYLEARVPPGKKLLRVNFDETAVCLFQGKGKGNMFIAKRRKTAQNIPKWFQRAHLTHVAFCCDDLVIQRSLPQIIIANERVLPKKQLAALRRSCPPNVRLIRAKSAWVNAPLCAQMVRWLAAALKPYVHEVQPVLLFDACKQHTAPPVWSACAAVGVWPHLVPALMTWLLQPLDTHTFALYNMCLQNEYQMARIRTADGIVGVAELLGAMCGAIRQVLEGRDWSHAFAHDGFGSTQGEVSERVLRELQVDAPPVISSSLPTEDQLQLCFPRRAKIPATLWRALIPRAAASRPRPVAIASGSAIAFGIGAPSVCLLRSARCLSVGGPAFNTRSRSRLSHS